MGEAQTPSVVRQVVAKKASKCYNKVKELTKNEPTNPKSKQFAKQDKSEKPQVAHPELQDTVVNIATEQVTTVDVTDLDQALAEQARHGLNQ